MNVSNDDMSLGVIDNKTGRVCELSVVGPRRDEPLLGVASTNYRCTVSHVHDDGMVSLYNCCDKGRSVVAGRKAAPICSRSNPLSYAIDPIGGFLLMKILDCAVIAKKRTRSSLKF
jgi:hypothetical protein